MGTQYPLVTASLGTQRCAIGFAIVAWREAVFHVASPLPVGKGAIEDFSIVWVEAFGNWFYWTLLSSYNNPKPQTLNPKRT